MSQGIALTQHKYTKELLQASDLAYTVQHLSQYMQKPRSPYLSALHHTLNYVDGTIGQGIILNGDTSPTLQAFSNSDWVSCVDLRRLVPRYILKLGNSPIGWKSKKQPTISRSYSESEYKAITSVAAEITSMIRLLGDLGIENLQPVTLDYDNSQPSILLRTRSFMKKQP